MELFLSGDSFFVPENKYSGMALLRKIKVKADRKQL